MDVLLSIATGLGLRIFLSGFDEPFRRITPALLGLWEGAVIHHLSHNSPSFDHYLAFGLRIALDLLITENLSRMMMVILWTALAMVGSEAANPAPRHESKRDRERRHRLRSVPSRIRIYQPTASPHLPLIPPNHTPIPKLNQHQTATPQLRPSRPPSPPSFFLEGESETNSNSPKPPCYLQSVFISRGSDTDSPPPLPMLLPTPPATLMTDAQEVEASSHRRLSTIEEISIGEDTTPVVSNFEHLNLPGGYAGFETTNPSHAPSVTTVAPLPVPNPTIRYIQKGSASYLAPEEPAHAPSVSMSAPLPVPNAGTQYSRVDWRPSTPSDPDELKTPNVANWELTDRDELRTPKASQKELSPLPSDQNLPLNFGVMRVPPILDDSGPVLAQSAPIDVKNTPTAGSSNPMPAQTQTVEYLSAAVDDTKPDFDIISEAESVQTETDATSTISNLTPTKLSSRAEILRTKAWNEERERKRLQDELLRASQEARIRDTLFIRKDIRESEARARRLHERAARRFFLAHNSSSKPHTVDVHGLRVAEALDMTEKALRDALTSGHGSIRVIVGKGLHSKDGVPVLKHALIRMMQGQKIPCRVDPSNAGVLILSLPP